MTSFDTERPSRRRVHPRWWTFVTGGALLLGVVGAKASAAWLGSGRAGAEPPSSTPETAARRAAEVDPELDAFIRGVVKDVDTLWTRDFKRRKKPYSSAEPVFLDAAKPSDCGPGLALGRQECNGAQKVYVDLSFHRALSERFGAEAQGVQAYVIAHEMGHHVQRVLGLDTKIDALLVDKPVASHWAEVQIELQADCFAGVWTRRAEPRGLVAPADIEAAIRRAGELGTERRIDHAENRTESFTYAIPRRRIYWFAQGYEHGEVDDCDTFAP